MLVKFDYMPINAPVSRIGNIDKYSPMSKSIVSSSSYAHPAEVESTAASSTAPPLIYIIDSLEPNSTQPSALNPDINYLREHNKALEAEVIRVKQQLINALKYEALYNDALVVIGEKQEQVQQLEEDFADLKRTLKEQALMISEADRVREVVSCGVETMTTIK